MPQPLWEERAARNEALFREVNENILGVGEKSTQAAVRTFVCECADASCAERVRVSLDVYENVRSSPLLFLLRPGHERPGIEEIVAKTREYVIVRKAGRAGDVAERTDPRD